jgi:hypothetical protein
MFDLVYRLLTTLLVLSRYKAELWFGSYGEPDYFCVYSYNVCLRAFSLQVSRSNNKRFIMIEFGLFDYYIKFTKRGDLNVSAQCGAYPF